MTHSPERPPRVIKRYSSLAPAPWANGAGSTVELVSFDESRRLTPRLPRWRLSVAALERCAPFSPLIGLHRSFMPIGGDVELAVDGEQFAVPDGVIHRFEGAQHVGLAHLPHPCNAMNLMSEGSLPVLIASRDRALITVSLAGDDPVIGVSLHEGPSMERFDLLLL